MIYADNMTVNIGKAYGSKAEQAGRKSSLCQEEQRVEFLATRRIRRVRSLPYCTTSGSGAAKRRDCGGGILTGASIKCIYSAISTSRKPMRVMTR